MKQRLKFEQLISEISSRLVGLAVEVDAGIDDALASIAPFSKADRAYMFLFRDGAHVDNTHEWCAEGVTPERERLQNTALEEELPWFFERLRSGEVLHVSHVSLLPRRQSPSPQLRRRRIERPQ